MTTTSIERPDLVTSQNGLGIRLAPPFHHWHREESPVPRGFTGRCTSNPWTGTVEMQLAAASDDPAAPLTIGWFWCGWWRHLYVNRRTLFALRFRTETLNVMPNGGRWIPRAYLTLQRNGGDPIEPRKILEAGRTDWLFVSALGPGTYRLGVSFNVRAAYERQQRPTGLLKAHFLDLSQQALFAETEAPAAEAADLGDADDAWRAEADAFDGLEHFAGQEFDAAELAAARADLAARGTTELVDLSGV